MDKGTVIRTAALAVALINQFLVVFGKSPLPIDAEIAEQTVSFSFTLTTSTWAWFKNNYVTKTGRKQKQVLMENDLLERGES
ncbi:phage holin [Lentibacillus sp. CBA3610]|uniref:phage holin n=1 Tax=Lentibacillus sp. CBA3610 TaxID=2518176 RepID=UPI001595AAD8|nr:phage holin [Lentibacillus sp. CBA3610]QKY68868.1 phage holin [Lentibacillus sp. CBA3610]